MAITKERWRIGRSNYRELTGLVDSKGRAVPVRIESNQGPWAGVAREIFLRVWGDPG